MAVTVRAPFPAGTAGDIVAASTTITTSVTLLAGDDLELHCGYDKGSDTGITLSAKLDPAGANLSPDGSSVIVHANGASVGFEQVFWWLNASLSGAGLLGAGAKNVTVTASTSADSMEQKAYALTGADHNAPTVTTAVGSSTSAAVTSASCPSNGLAIGHFVGGSSFTATNNTNTLLQSGTSGNAGWNIAGNTAAGAGATISLTGTLPADFWAAIATVWAPAGAAPTVAPPAMIQRWPTQPQLIGPWPMEQVVLDPGANLSQAVPIGIDTAEAFGIPAAAQNVTVSPTGIASAEAFGSPTKVIPTPYIVGASADGTHFIDQYGNPRLFIGADDWNILAGGGAWNSGNYQSTFDTYFAQRAAQGYTAVEVSWASYANALSALPHTDGSDWDAVFPFSTSMNPSTTPNSTFWARRDYFFTSAAANGITVVMNVTTPSLWDTIPQRSWTTTQWQNFGTFLGNRYKTQPNILWIFGDDYFGDLDSNLSACLTALRATGDTHLVSMQNFQEATSRQDIYTLTKDPNPFNVHSQYEWGYSYNVSYDVVEKGQIYTPTVSDDVQGVTPVLWADGRYLSTSVGAGQTDDRLQRQMVWWALSSGACGVSVGDDAIWVWASSSAAAVTGRAFYTSTMPAIAAAFGGLTNWQKLHPDTSSQLVTAGRGTHAAAIVSGGSGTYYIANTDNYVTASRSPDTGSGSALAVIYCAQAMNITIDQTKMASGYTATWFDPLTGATFAGTPGSTYNSATARGNNSAGDPDWVLVLAATGLTVSPAGIASGEAFGTAVMSGALTVSPTGIGSAEAFGTASATFVLTVSPTGIASAEQFGTSTEGSILTVQPTGITSAEAFGTAAASGALTAQPAGIASAETFGTAVVSLLLTASPVGIASAQAFGTAVVSVGSLTAAPTGIASSEAFGTPVATMGALTVSPAGIMSAEAFGSAAVNTTGTSAPTGIPSAEAFGTATVSTILTASPTGIASAQAFGVPAATAVLAVTAVGIASSEAFGVTAAVLLLVASPTGIASAGAVGTPAAALSLMASLAGIASGEAFGTVLVTGGATIPPRDLSLKGSLQPSLLRGTIIPGRFAGSIEPGP